MWTADSWKEFRAGRFVKWLQIFEETGKRHGLTLDSGFFLGTDKATVADTSLVALWSSIERSLPELADDLREHAPMVMALCDRMLASSEGLQQLFVDVGPKLFCGGQIEASLRE